MVSRVSAAQARASKTLFDMQALCVSLPSSTRSATADQLIAFVLDARYLVGRRLFVDHGGCSLKFDHHCPYVSIPCPPPFLPLKLVVLKRDTRKHTSDTLDAASENATTGTSGSRSRATPASPSTVARSCPRSFLRKSWPRHDAPRPLFSYCSFW